MEFSFEAPGYFYQEVSSNFNVNIVKAGYQKNPVLKGCTKHIHGPVIRDYFVLYYYTKGSGTLTVNGLPFHLTAGQAAVTFPGSTIIECTELPDPWEYYYIFLKGSSTAVHLHSFGIHEENPVFSWKNSQVILGNFLQLAEFFQADTDESLFLQVAELCKLFANLKRLTSSAPNTPLLPQEHIAKALKIFENNYYLDISVEDVANELGLSRCYFTRLFKSFMHMSPKDYLIQFRIQRACEFLAVPNSTVASVANSVGYDPVVFSRTFKRLIGVSPSQYKKFLSMREDSSP